MKLTRRVFLVSGCAFVGASVGESGSVQQPVPPPQPSDSASFDIALPVPTLTYIGSDTRGRPEIDFNRPANVLEGDSLEIERGVSSTFASSLLESKLISIAEGAATGYALLNTRDRFVLRARFVRGSAYGSWSAPVTNDIR